MKVFVYGTLKKNYGNHILLRGATLVTENAITIPHFFMTSVGYPVALNKECISSSVKLPIIGEVYEIEQSHLIYMDRLEGVPHHYDRITIECKDLNNNEIIDEVFMYIGNSFDDTFCLRREELAKENIDWSKKDLNWRWEDGKAFTQPAVR